MKSSRLLLEELAVRFEVEIDVFICSASFEERCLSIPRHLNRKLVRRALIAENENHLGLHAGNGSRLMDMFEGRAEHVWLDTTNPLKTADSLQLALRRCAEERVRHILVDITTFTHEGMLILFGLLRERFREARITYLYAGASEYSVGDVEENKWLSKGIGEIRSVLGYSGRFLPSQKLHLVVMVGFEHERVGELIRQYEPSYISLGYGESTEPGAEKHHPVNMHGFEQVKAIYPQAEDFVFYCYDPFKTKEIVRQQAGRHQNTNVVIATFNTKISTLGAALAALEDDSIQICYAQALVYNYAAYSLPGDKVYLVDML